MEGELANGSINEPEAPIYDVETVNKAGDISASPEKILETSEDVSQPPTKKKSTYKRKGNQRGKIRAVFKEPAASPEAQDTDGDAVKDDTFVAATNDANPEGESSKGSGVAPKRKRGRPVGSLSGSVIGEANKAQASIGATREKSTRRRCAVLESAIRTLKPRSKKRKSATGTSTSEKGTEAKKGQAKAIDPPTNGVGESGPPASNEAVPPISDEDMPLSTWIAEADHATAEKDPPARRMPFAKTSPVWEAIDSLEVFRKLPQNPHFRPLFLSEENIREGLAVGAMVIFSGLVEKISAFTFDAPASLLEGYLETLGDLETYGFSVGLIRERVTALLGIKKRYDEAQALSGELIKEKEAMSEVEKVLEEIEGEIRALEEERSAAMAKKAAKEDEIRARRVRLDAMRDFVEGARGEFARMADAPW